MHSAAGPGLHRVAPRAWRPPCTPPRRAREGCHRTTESGLQPPAPSLSVVQRRKAVVDAQQHVMRDERREQRRARAARLIAGLLTHQGDDQLADFLVIGSVESFCTDPRRRWLGWFPARCRRRLSMPHAWEAVGRSTNAELPTRYRPRARVLWVGVTIVSGRRRRRWQK